MSFIFKARLRSVIVGVAVGFAAVVAFAQQGGITIYNAQHVSLTREWVEAFTKETGIKVTVRNGGDSELSNQLVQEGANSPADVFLTENSPAMTLVDNYKLFEPIDAATLAQVPAEYRPANGHWIGIAARSTVLVYQKLKFTADKLPKSIMDLAKPEWKGRWGAAPAGADFQAIVSGMLQLKGEEATLAWLKSMKENVVPFRGNSIAMKAVGDGQIDAAVIYHYYYFGDIGNSTSNTERTRLHYFRNQDPGAFVSVSGAGVLASSKNKPQAQAFIKWVTGKGGQEILRTGRSYEYAVGVGASSNRNLVPLADLQAPRVEMGTLNTGKVSELMLKAGLL